MTTVRMATDADRDAVVALWQSCDLTRPWNDPGADFDRALGHDASTILLAEAESAVVGTIMVGFDGHRGWVYYLGVRPDRRGTGIARRLLDEGCDWLRARGCPKVELMVRDGNPATGLYERLDWEYQPVRVFARWLGQKG